MRRTLVWPAALPVPLGASPGMAYACLSVHRWGRAVLWRDLVDLATRSLSWLVPVLGAGAFGVTPWGFADHQAVYWFLHGFVDPTGLAVFVGLPHAAVASR